MMRRINKYFVFSPHFSLLTRREEDIFYLVELSSASFGCMVHHRYELVLIIIHASNISKLTELSY